MSRTLDMILDAAAKVFDERCTVDVMDKMEAGEWPSRLWEDVTETGITWGLVSEVQNGTGLTVEEGLAIIRLAGYYCVPIPLAETMVAAKVLADAGFDVPDGPLSLAAGESGCPLRAEPDGDTWRLTGSHARVPWGEQAAVVIARVVTDTGERLGYFDTTAFTDVVGGTNLAFEPRASLAPNTLSVSDSMLFAWPYSSGTLFTLGALIRAQQLAGAMQRALDLSTQYVSGRIQFGRPLGKFQAIQQQLAAMAGEAAAASAAADMAAQSWDTDQAEFTVAVAKARTSEAAGKVAATAHQVHGAMGFTREHPLHYATRRLWSWRDEFGTESLWQQWLGRTALDIGADELWAFLVKD